MSCPSILRYAGEFSTRHKRVLGSLEYPAATGLMAGVGGRRRYWAAFGLFVETESGDDVWTLTLMAFGHRARTDHRSNIWLFHPNPSV